MRSPFNSRAPRVRLAAVLAFALLIASTAAVDAKRPPPPPPPPPPSGGGSATVVIAPSGTLEPSGEYLNVDVTVTCPVGWTSAASTVRQRPPAAPGRSADLHGHATGRPREGGQREPIHARQLDRHCLRGIARNGQQVHGHQHEDDPARAGRHGRVANQGQLTGTSGGGVRIAVAVACPIGATGRQSYVAVSQGGTALGRALHADLRPPATRSSSRSRPHRGRSRPAAPSPRRSSTSPGTARRSPGSTTGRSRSSSRRPATPRRRRRPPA